MRILYIFPFLLTLFFSLSYGAYGIDAILSDIEKQSDLSESTKQESVGHLNIFTRQELDILQISTIKDLMEYVNFLGYSENNKGLPDFSFIPDMTKDVSYMKVFIDDQPLYSPFFGNGIQFYGRLDLNFVDHVEIYWGAPSFTFGLGSSYMVIKLYSKKPERENINTINAYAGSYSTYGINGFSSKKYDDFSYLLSISRRDLKQKNMYKYDGFPLKRDQISTFMYTKFYLKNSFITLNALKSKYNIFMGDSQVFKPIKNKEKQKSFFISYDYLSNDQTLKAHLSFYQGDIKSNERADPLLYYILPEGNFQKMSSQDFYIDEAFIDGHISKTFTFKNNTLDIGLKNRYQSIKQPTIYINGQKHDIKYNYTHQFNTSLYFENKYLFDDKNLFLTSAIYNRRHNKIKDFSQNDYSFKIGYIHNEQYWFTKLFGYYSKDSSLIHNFYNLVNFSSLAPERQSIKSYSGEIGFKIPKSQISLAYARLIINPKTPLNKIYSNLASLNFNHKFNSFHHIKSSLWHLDFDLNNNVKMFQGLINNKHKKHGAYMILFSKLGEFELANSIFYTKNDNPKEDIYRVNSAINYNIDKNFKIYLKLNNIFNKSPKKSYIGTTYNGNKAIIQSEQFQLYDRVIYLGAEYSF